MQPRYLLHRRHIRGCAIVHQLMPALSHMWALLYMQLIAWFLSCMRAPYHNRHGSCTPIRRYMLPFGAPDTHVRGGSVAHPYASPKH